MTRDACNTTRRRDVTHARLAGVPQRVIRDRLSAVVLHASRGGAVYRVNDAKLLSMLEYVYSGGGSIHISLNWFTSLELMAWGNKKGLLIEMTGSSQNMKRITHCREQYLFETDYSSVGTKITQFLCWICASLFSPLLFTLK